MSLSHYIPPLASRDFLCPVLARRKMPVNRRALAVESNSPLLSTLTLLQLISVPLLTIDHMVTSTSPGFDIFINYRSYGHRNCITALHVLTPITRDAQWLPKVPQSSRKSSLRAVDPASFRETGSGRVLLPSNLRQAASTPSE